MRRADVLRPRKEPRQSRSRQLRDDILEASVRVLRRDGPRRFTTSRVADAAGVSVGSLYQYFPNKQALLFALHSQAVEASLTHLRVTLARAALTPRQRLRRVALHFFQVEAAETSAVGQALRELEPAFEREPAHQANAALAAQTLARFLAEAGARLPPAKAAEVCFVVLEAVGKSVAGRALSAAALRRWAHTAADMVAHAVGLPLGRPRVSRREPAERAPA